MEIWMCLTKKNDQNCWWTEFGSIDQQARSNVWNHLYQNVPLATHILGWLGELEKYLKTQSKDLWYIFFIWKKICAVMRHFWMWCTFILCFSDCGMTALLILLILVWFWDWASAQRWMLQRRRHVLEYSGCNAHLACTGVEIRDPLVLDMNCT